MTDIKLDFEPIARQVYDFFLLSVPGVPVEGLFQHDGKYFIVSPALDTQLADGRTVAAWYEAELMPLGMGIFLVKDLPSGAVELACRSAAQVADGFGIVRTRNTVRRDLALMLPTGFPFLSISVENRTLVVGVSRALEDTEHTALISTIEQVGDPLPVDVRVTQAEAPATTPTRAVELVPTRLQRELPAAVRSFLEADEDYWRGHYRRVIAGSVRPEDILVERHFRQGEACLVGAPFPQGYQNIRTYLSLYRKVVLIMPLREHLTETLTALGVSKRSLLELVDRQIVFFIVPQSVERYDSGFLNELIDVRPEAVVGSRKLAAAVHADQVIRNPLFVFPGAALDRRAILRVLPRVAERQPAWRMAIAALAEGLTRSWPSYEYALHVRGAMAPISGPLANVGRALAQRLTGKDYFVELGSAALNIEWASALGTHFSPFEAAGYSEVGHCELLVALHSGTGRNSTTLARPSEFQVANDLLVINNDVDLIDFVTALGEGDMVRFRDLVRSLAQPGRSQEECRELVDLWNRQVRQYERKADRLRSMGLAGLVLGPGAQMLGMPEIVSLSAAVLPFLPAALGLMQEELIGALPRLGEAVDRMNATLAGVQPHAVLLARLKKLVGGMK